jgi:hypothetical protein
MAEGLKWHLQRRAEMELRFLTLQHASLCSSEAVVSVTLSQHKPTNETAPELAVAKT